MQRSHFCTMGVVCLSTLSVTGFVAIAAILAGAVSVLRFQARRLQCSA